MELQVLEAAQSEFEKLGASLVALSTKTGSNSRKSARQNKLTFQILFDAKGAVGAAFGLRFQLPDSLIELYNCLKNDLPAFNGDTSWSCRCRPATSSEDGTILYAEVNPDYTCRPEPADMLPALRREATSRAA